MISFTKKKTKKKAKKKEEESESEETMTLADLIQSRQEDMPESRSIMFVGEVTEDKAAEFISALLVLAQTKDDDAEKTDDIKIYINTYGGSADEMFAIYDVMNWCKELCDIQTIGLGKVMSAGTLILAAGTKGNKWRDCKILTFKPCPMKQA